MAELRLDNVESTTLSYAFSEGKSFDGSNEIPEGHVLVSREGASKSETFCLLAKPNGRPDISLGRNAANLATTEVRFVLEGAIPKRCLPNS